jgi:hypothetical protein
VARQAAHDTRRTTLVARHRSWATSSLIAGMLWVLLAVSPTFVTTLLGLPLAAYAMVVGWLTRRSGLRAGDRAGARRASWGVGLGCAGLVYLTAWYALLGGVVIASLMAFLRTLGSETLGP